MELRVSSVVLQHQWDFSSRTLGEQQEWHIQAIPGGWPEVDTAAQEAERLGLTTATMILRMARLWIEPRETP